MVVPDLLWLAPQLVGGAPWAHEPWRDVFLFHVSLDHGPRAWPAMPATVALAAAAVGAQRRWAAHDPAAAPG